MEVINGLVGVLPGGGIAAMAMWFALRKDAQCTDLMEKLHEIAVKQAASSEQVAGALNSLRDAIKLGTR
ncbi:MAG TPA: hypothetical protein VF638_03000 [Sphingomonas sp.]